MHLTQMEMMQINLKIVMLMMNLAMKEIMKNYYKQLKQLQQTKKQMKLLLKG